MKESILHTHLPEAQFPVDAQAASQVVSEYIMRPGNTTVQEGIIHQVL